jgi:hypothetical protein
MRGDVVFCVYGVHEGRAVDSCFGAFRTRAEAEAEVVTLSARVMHGGNWAARYYNKGSSSGSTSLRRISRFPHFQNLAIDTS